MAKLSYQQTYLFCEQMAMILKSGMSLEEGIEAIASQTDASTLKEMLEKCLVNIQNHHSFYESVSELDYFDDYLVHMIDVGEKSGHLDDVMGECALYYQRMDETRTKFKDALTYPTILLVMMMVVLGVIVIQVLPIFQQVLTNLGASLTGVALSLMQLGVTLANYGLYVLVAVIVLLVVSMIVLRVRHKEHALTVFFEKFWPTRRLMEDMSVAQFAYAMSLLMNSGYDSSQALEMVVDMIRHNKIKRKVAESSEKVKNGASFEDEMVRNGIFKNLYSKMLHIGFRTGHGDETMARIAEEYEREVDSALNRFLNLIEPTLVAVLSILVGIILLSVMLPLMSIMSTIG